MACQPCWVSLDPCPHSCVDQPSLFPLTLPSFSSGDLGGQMGLFIGASILTLLEILDYIYEVRTREERPSEWMRLLGGLVWLGSGLRVLEVRGGLALKRLDWSMGTPRRGVARHQVL